MKIWIFSFIFIFNNLFPLTLQEKFDQGETGSYIVTEKNGLVSLLHFHSKTQDSFIFEEVSIPFDRSKTIDWVDWMQKGAPGHTSWILYTIDSERKCMTKCYSVTQQAWIFIDEIETLLIPFMSLQLDFLSEKERLRTGIRGKAGHITSSPWSPPQVINGQKITDPQYDVYIMKWPQDRSDLSGKRIILYFDKNRQTFPFPYWLQVGDTPLKFKIRALDSGTGLISPYTTMPQRITFSEDDQH